MTPKQKKLVKAKGFLDAAREICTPEELPLVMSEFEKLEIPEWEAVAFRQTYKMKEGLAEGAILARNALHEIRGDVRGLGKAPIRVPPPEAVEEEEIDGEDEETEGLEKGEDDEMVPD